jgi:serine/threonine protein phosphatase 1
MKMPNVKMLLGNHEYMMLDAAIYFPEPNESWTYLECSEELKLWDSNGGAKTLRSLKYMRKTMREELFNFVRTLPINIDVEVNGTKYILCHASPLQNYSKHPFYSMLYGTDLYFAVWKRWQPHDGVPEGSRLIFGHTPTCNLQEGYPWRIYEAENAFGIDCGGAYEEGRLLCLRLDDMKEFYSEYVYDEIYRRADGKAFLSPELKAKDEARYQLRGLIKKETGIDIEKCESPEDEIDRFLFKRSTPVLFDERGNIVRWIHG